MRYLVTGGAGFIGSHLIDRLLKEDHQVVCFDNFDDFYNPVLKWGNVTKHVNNPKFTLISGTVVEQISFEKAFKTQPDAVIHLAAQAGVRPSVQNPKLHYDVNVGGTLNMLEFCKKYEVEKVVFASSSSVYGNYPKVPFDEAMKVDSPLCPYASSKKAGENLCYVYHHLYNMDIACIRPFTVYGIRQRLEMAIPLFTKLIYNNEILKVYGDGSTKRDYTYVLDVVDGIVEILKRKHGFEVYNLGTAQPVPLWNIINGIAKRIGHPFPPQIQHYPEGIGEAKITYANIDKARGYLGYDPKFNIDLGLDQYVEWYVKEQKEGR
ncbi:MAG: NAD-dependent epimerase/dehydratase family protein [bacterium]